MCLDDFYRLLRSTVVQLDPYWYQKNLAGLLSTPPEKYGKNCKTYLWDEKQNRAVFLDHPNQSRKHRYIPCDVLEKCVFDGATTRSLVPQSIVFQMHNFPMHNGSMLG